MKKIIQPLKGTRDFYPEVMAIRNWLYGTLRQISEAFGYQEYDGPFLESLQLYEAKSGEELVKEQSYVFPDRSGDLITLRPELTPSLARMIAQRQGQLVIPLRWWSFGPFWRYERPQKGRTREFYQWNIDLIGVNSPEADAELVAILAMFFREVDLSPKQVDILVSNRRLLNDELIKLRIPPELRGPVSNCIDRRNKMALEEWDAYVLDTGLNPELLDRLKEWLQNKESWLKFPDMVRFFDAIDALGIRDYVHFDPHIVRGLPYYTGTVFEAFEIAGDIRRSICGGGRYDDLMADVGGDPLPAVGFALGDVVITLLLEKYGCIPQGIGRSSADVLVTVFDDERMLTSTLLASELRQAGLKVATFPEPAKLPKQFRYADRMGIKVAVVLGPDEVVNNQVTIKDLQTGIQQTVPQSGASQAIKQLLESDLPS